MSFNGYYNFITCQREQFDSPLPPEDRLNEFIPQDPAALAAYNARLKIGHSPYMAWARTLDVCSHDPDLTLSKAVASLGL